MLIYGMSSLVKTLSVISLLTFTIAALIGFNEKSDPKTLASKFAIGIKKLLKKIIRWNWFVKWLDQPYSLTTIGLWIGFICGLLSIIFS
jgi:hypothetical protein